MTHLRSGESIDEHLQMHCALSIPSDYFLIFLASCVVLYVNVAGRETAAVFIIDIICHSLIPISVYIYIQLHVYFFTAYLHEPLSGQITDSKLALYFYSIFRCNAIGIVSPVTASVSLYCVLIFISLLAFIAIIVQFLY